LLLDFFRLVKARGRLWWSGLAFAMAFASLARRRSFRRFALGFRSQPAGCLRGF
jgi:hypothetical protein